jgi:hypothetical protein
MNCMSSMKSDLFSDKNNCVPRNISITTTKSRSSSSSSDGSSSSSSSPVPSQPAVLCIIRRHHLVMIQKLVLVKCISISISISTMYYIIQ